MVRFRNCTRPDVRLVCIPEYDCVFAEFKNGQNVRDIQFRECRDGEQKVVNFVVVGGVAISLIAKTITPQTSPLFRAKALNLPKPPAADKRRGPIDD